MRNATEHTPTPGRFGFSHEIEGLRALAVTAVVLYHAKVPFLTGGFVGVDVFFVVSGFLITSLLIAEHERTGSVSLRDFYARRFRRLLPAAALVLAATVVAARFLFDPLRLEELRADAVRTVLFAANWGFADRGTSYLNADLLASPLQHFWSLAVEEQFYALWPLLLVLVAGRSARPRARVAVLAATVVAASLAVSVVLTSSNQPQAFFLLPARAWEMAAGALLALGVPVLSRMRPGLRAVLGWAGLTAVGFSFVRFDGSFAFPGVWALVPVAGTLAVLAAGSAPAGPRLVLANRLTGFVGARSYAWYLWHWPAFILTESALGRPLQFWESAAVVAGTLLAAALTFALLEDPVRRSAALTWRPALSFAAGAGASAAALAVALVALQTPAAFTGGPASVPSASTPGTAAPADQEPGAGAGEVPGSPVDGPLEAMQALVRAALSGGPLPEDVSPPLAELRDDLPVIYDDGCHLHFGVTDIPAGCVYGNPDGPVTVVLTGDSHAAQWFTPLEALAVERNWRLVNLTKRACPLPAVTVHLYAQDRPFPECADWQQSLVARIEAEQPDLVIVAQHRYKLIDEEGEFIDKEDADPVWDRGFRSTLAPIAAAAQRLLMLSDTPTPTVDVAECLARNRAETLECATPRSEAVPDARLELERAAVGDVGGMFADTTAWLCVDGTCPAVVDGVVVYRDTNHLANGFAVRLAPLLAAVLDQALAETAAGRITADPAVASAPPVRAESATSSVSFVRP